MRAFKQQQESMMTFAWISSSINVNVINQGSDRNLGLFSIGMLGVFINRGDSNEYPKLVFLVRSFEYSLINAWNNMFDSYILCVPYMAHFAYM